MKRNLAVVAAVLALGGCGRKVAQNHVQPVRATTRSTAMVSPIQRQITNAVDAGEGDAEVRSLRQRMAADPDNLSIRLELAARYKKQGYPELALEHYRLAAERHPNDEKLLATLAQALAEQNQTAEAASRIDQYLVKNKPTTSELPAWLGIFRDELGEYTSAETAHRQASALNPSNAKIHNNLGYNLLLQGKREAAIEEFRRALSLDSKLVAARNNLGSALMRNPGPKERQEAFAMWLGIGGDRAGAHNNAAAALIEIGHYTEAREEIEAALKINRYYTPALKNLELLGRLDGKPAVWSAATMKNGKASQSSGSGWSRAWKLVWQAVAGQDAKPAPTNGLALNK